MAVFRFIYLFMVKMHLIYDCDGYSSFTGTNSFRIHFVGGVVFGSVFFCYWFIIVIRFTFFLSSSCMSVRIFFRGDCQKGLLFWLFGHWHKIK